MAKEFLLGHCPGGIVPGHQGFRYAYAANGKHKGVINDKSWISKVNIEQGPEHH
jgi:hypothetical protein